MIVVDTYLRQSGVDVAPQFTHSLPSANKDGRRRVLENESLVKRRKKQESTHLLNIFLIFLH